MEWMLLGLCVSILSFISASYHKSRGYFFWRTFFMACLGFTALGLLLYKLLLT